MFCTYVRKETFMSGKTIRLRRIIKENNKTVIVALDHGQFQGPIAGIENIEEILKKIVAGGPDAVILNPGILEKHSDIIAGKTSCILRITGASTNYSPSFDYHRLTTSVEHAVALGADAVIVMGFIGGVGENPSLEIIGKVSETCSRLGVPLVAEMLPQDFDHFTDPVYIANGTRAAYELGADIIKVYYTGKDSFDKITGCVPAPVVIAGGPKGKDAFAVASEGLEVGASGVAYGRNVFQADDPTAYVKKLVEIIHC